MTQLPNATSTIYSPILAGGVVIASAGQWDSAASRATSAVLAALDRRTGTILWVNTLPFTEFRGKAAKDNQLFVGTFDRQLLAYDLASGKELWQAQTDSSVTSTPVADDNNVYIGNDADEVAAFDRNSGTKVWQISMLGGVRSPILLSGHDVYARDQRGTVIALDAQTGQETWRVVTKSSGTDDSALAINSAGDTLYSPGAMDDGRAALVALNSADGTVRWRFPTSNAGSRPEVAWPPAEYAGHVYAGTFSGTLYAIDGVTGLEVWHRDIGAEGISTPVLVGRILLLTSYDNRLHALSI